MNSIKTIRSVSRGYRHAKRYNQILSILVKNGFGFIFENFDSNNFFAQIFRRKAEKGKSLLYDEKSLGQRLINTLVELGPTFVKMGQVLSCRPDIIPDKLLNPLAELQANVPPFPFAEVRKIIQEELGTPIECLFQNFSETPSGSASIAQGYQAVLKDGRKVFVKVQRPDIVQKIKVDLEILANLSEYLEQSIPELAIIKPTKMLDDFRVGFLDELDFLNEAANMRAFQRQFSDEEAIVIPEPVPGYCTQRVLTMTLIEGIPSREYKALAQSGINCRELAQMGVKLLLKQIFTYGFFHGDPHPGNMFFLPGPKLSYVDFGVMGRLTLGERILLKKITAAMFIGDMREMARDMAELSEAPEQINLEGLERDLATLISAHLHGSVKDLNVVQFSLDFYKICYRQHLCLKPHFCRMIRALGYADAQGREIAPDFNIMETLRPFIMEQSLNRLNPVKNLREAINCLNEWGDLFQQLPHLSTTILRQLKDGTLTVNHRQDDVRHLAEKVASGSRRLSQAILLSMLLIISAIFMVCKIPPVISGQSALGMLGFIVSIICVFVHFMKES